MSDEAESVAITQRMRTISAAGSFELAKNIQGRQRSIAFGVSTARAVLRDGEGRRLPALSTSKEGDCVQKGAPLSVAVARALDNFQARPPMRAWSLIITLYGDAIVPRGGSLWLGSLVKVMSLFNIDAGHVRTAMSRLTADGWLTREKAGRNSYYRLTRREEGSFNRRDATHLFRPCAGVRWPSAAGPARPRSRRPTFRAPGAGARRLCCADANDLRRLRRSGAAAEGNRRRLPACMPMRPTMSTRSPPRLGSSDLSPPPTAPSSPGSRRLERRARQR